MAYIVQMFYHKDFCDELDSFTILPASDKKEAGKYIQKNIKDLMIYFIEMKTHVANNETGKDLNPLQYAIWASVKKLKGKYIKNYTTKLMEEIEFKLSELLPEEIIDNFNSKNEYLLEKECKYLLKSDEEKHKKNKKLPPHYIIEIKKFDITLGKNTISYSRNIEKLSDLF